MVLGGYFVSGNILSFLLKDLKFSLMILDIDFFKIPLDFLLKPKVRGVFHFSLCHTLPT